MVDVIDAFCDAEMELEAAAVLVAKDWPDVLVVLFESSVDEVGLETLLLERVELLLEASFDIVDPEVDDLGVDDVIIEFVLLEIVLEEVVLLSVTEDESVERVAELVVVAL